MMNQKFKIALGVTLGGVLGYGYYALVGCSSGGCAITSNPWISTAFGSMAGFLIVGPKE
jgi:hypothetical protein